MLNPDREQECGILYIDDEEKALKYFRMAFSEKYRVFTAPSGDEGLELLRAESSRIGIVLSDQRMPGKLGAEVLEVVRENYPHIIRILTTAYSDLDSAIQAVNKGFIYQYVVKPWDMTELGMLLSRAADYHRILSERNALLSLKMTSLQRIILCDRLKWFLVASRSLPEPAGSEALRAILALIKALPDSLPPVVRQSGADLRGLELPSIFRKEFNNAIHCLESIETGSAQSSAVEKLPHHLRDIIQQRFTGVHAALGARLADFLADLIFSFELDPEKVQFAFSDSSISYPSVRVDEPFDSGFVDGLFGLLLARETPSLAIHLLALLTALAHENGGLVVSENSGATSFRFTIPPASADLPGEIIAAFEQKFARWDIASL